MRLRRSVIVPALAMAAACSLAASLWAQVPKKEAGGMMMGSSVSKAIAVLHATKSGGEAHGEVTFTKVEGGIEVAGSVSGLTPGEHGFHIHEYGDPSSPDAMSAGGHFNPDKMEHGALKAEKRHVGDLDPTHHRQRASSSRQDRSVHRPDPRLLRPSQHPRPGRDRPRKARRLQAAHRQRRRSRRCWGYRRRQAVSSGSDFAFHLEGREFRDREAPAFSRKNFVCTIVAKTRMILRGGRDNGCRRDGPGIIARVRRDHLSGERAGRLCVAFRINRWQQKADEDTEEDEGGGERFDQGNLRI